MGCCRAALEQRAAEPDELAIEGLPREMRADDGYRLARAERVARLARWMDNRPRCGRRQGVARRAQLAAELSVVRARGRHENRIASAGSEKRDARWQTVATKIRWDGDACQVHEIPEGSVDPEVRVQNERVREDLVDAVDSG